MFSEYLIGYRSLSRTVSDMMWSQCKCSAAQLQLGMDWMDVLLVGPKALDMPVGPKEEATSPTKSKAEGLEKRAMERMKKGYAPPREIYDVRNRGQIDWANVPDWARVVDPELFEGCSHEG